MKKFIRNRSARTFLMKDGGWTNNIAQAWQFDGHDEVVRARNTFQLKDVEIYYSFKDEDMPQYDFCVPID